MEKDIESLIEQLTKVRPEMLNEEALKLFNTIMDVLDERDLLKRQIEIKDSYLSLMWDLGVDYDGWDTVDSLKSLIDDLVDYAKKAVKNDDKYAVYQGGNGKYFNILREEVEKEDK